MRNIYLYAFCLLAFTVMSCKNKEENKAGENKISVKEEQVSYMSDGMEMKSYIAYDENNKNKRPAILVVPEWWGVNDYVRSRIKQLAELGYVAMAVDFYGNGKQADNPDSAGKFATPFYADPQMAKRRFDAAKEKLVSYLQVDSSKLAAMGYCFGGAQVINMAKLGEDLKGVVSFHGNLAVMPPTTGMKADVLVCHGDDDKFVSPEEVATFKKQMDSVGAHYTFVSYPGATHSFTNPQATEWGKKFNLPLAYNENADTLSWKEMKSFFERVLR
jgi:dienelactone hydrolase